MKLTNISLAVLVALGLVACGGSDDNKNQTTDNQNAGHQTGGNGGAGGAGTPPTPPKGDDSKTVKDPDNRAAALEVEKRLETNTAAAKTVYANTRKSLDVLMGYDKDTGNTFEKGSVDSKNEDLKREVSIVNYMQAGWINDETSGGNIRLHPTQTYARAKDGKFYRVRFIKEGEDLTKNKSWDKALPTDTFAATGGVSASHGSHQYSASELYFIPNAQTSTTPGMGDVETFIPDTGAGPVAAAKLGAPETASTLGDGVILGTTLVPGVNLIEPSKDTFYDPTRGDVRAVNILVGGKSYDVNGAGSSNSYKLDLGLNPKEDIQTVPVQFTYNIVDDKGTVELRDDDYITKTADAGELRVYNLNYSLALLEVNEAAKDNSGGTYAAARNGLGFEGGIDNVNIIGFGRVSGKGRDGRYGPYQVQGFQTTALPFNGRATYLGQSFGVNSKGQIDLTLDLGENRAGIHGSVTKRTTMDGKTALPDMNLNLINLSQPGYNYTGSVGLNSNSKDAKNGVVDLGGATNWGTWAVQLYGPNAENAAGVIAKGFQPDGGVNDYQLLENVVEVFDSARTDINPKSLNNPKNP